MRTKLIGSALLLTLMIVPTTGRGQFPGMGGGGMGFDMSKMNPDFLFSMLSKGKDTINRDEMDERGQRMFDRFAPMLGITGTVLTKDQFRESMAKVQEMAKNGQLPIPGAGGAPAIGGAPGGFPGLGGGGTDRIAEERFKQYDKNQDGVIAIDELPEDHALRNEREKYDTNKDGVYNLEEFKAYVNVRMAGMTGNAPPQNPMPGDTKTPNPREDNDPDRRPTIVRPANLPRDLPSWFAELDRNGDRDGQVGLYEWKEGGKKITEFLTMDLNNDGFLTVEEFYRWKKKSDEEARKNGGDSASNQFARGGDRGDRGGNDRAMMGGGDRGGPPGGGRFPGMGGGDQAGGGRFPGMGGPPGGGRFPGMGGGDQSGGGRFPGMGSGGDQGGGRFPGMGSGGPPGGGRFPGMGSGGDQGSSGRPSRGPGGDQNSERPSKKDFPTDGKGGKVRPGKG